MTTTPTPSLDFSGTAADNYERYFVPAIARPVSGDLLAVADLQPGERVLDVACGTGLIARLAAEQVGPAGTVAGIDLAPDMIDVARALPAPAGAAVEWHAGDATSLPFAEATFDAVFCQMGLMFMPDRSRAVAEMRRVLAPGGRLVVNTPGAIQVPLVVLEQALVEHISPDVGGFVRAVFCLHDPDTVAAILRDAGLREVEVTVATAGLGLPAPVEFLWQYINSTPLGPVVARAPEEARRSMEHQAVEGWQAHLTADGTIGVEQPMVLARGRR